MKKIKIVLVFIFIFLVVMSLNSRYVETSNLTTKEYTIKSNIDESYNGLKIVHFGDLHYGNIVTKEFLKNIKEEINLINPDLIFFTGDLINRKITTTEQELLTDFLANINSKYGKYAVLGEKDYKDLTKIKNIFIDSDFILLENNFEIIYNENNEKIFLGGLSSINKNANIDIPMEYFKTNENINYKIILVHEPDYASEILTKYKDINLILSGHSHNGQIVLPFYGGIISKKGATKYKDNYYQIKNTDLYITSGLGVNDINMRFNNKPSINFYRIIKK